MSKSEANSRDFAHKIGNLIYSGFSENDLYLWACECARRAIERAVATGECSPDDAILCNIVSRVESFARGDADDLPGVDEIREAIERIAPGSVLDGKTYPTDKPTPDHYGSLYLLALQAAYSTTHNEAPIGAAMAAEYARAIPGAPLGECDPEEARLQIKRLAEMIEGGISQ